MLGRVRYVCIEMIRSARYYNENYTKCRQFVQWNSIWLNKVVYVVEFFKYIDIF